MKKKKETKEREFIIGRRNKKGIFKKVKWFPNSIVISQKEYKEYLEYKELKEKHDM